MAVSMEIGRSNSMVGCTVEVGTGDWKVDCNCEAIGLLRTIGTAGIVADHSTPGTAVMEQGY
jgi:hypothetical protein